jgi:hypothetical protein
MKLFSALLVFICGLFVYCSSERGSTSLQEIGYDDDGMITRKGQRVFIIGSYYLPKGEDSYRILSESGYNLIRVGEKQDELDQAQAHGLNAWVSIGSMDPSGSAATGAAYRERIRRLKDHPALLCWEMEDEPAWRWNSADCRVKPDDLIKSYQAIKLEDPKHLVYMNHAPTNLVSTLQRYNASTDIVACDIYPVIPGGIRTSFALFPDGMQGDLLNIYPSQVGAYTDKMRAVAGAGRTLFMVLQGFAWEMLREKTERDSVMIKYPNYEESRFMAFNAIIHGANGIIYWGTAYTPQPSLFWSDLKAVTIELAGLQQILASRTIDLSLKKVYHELGHSVDVGVEILAKSVSGVTYLLTANADKNPIRVGLSGLRGFQTAAVLSERRKVRIVEGVLTDDYAPFAVHIYQLEK